MKVSKSTTTLRNRTQNQFRNDLNIIKINVPPKRTDDGHKFLNFPLNYGISNTAGGNINDKIKSSVKIFFFVYVYNDGVDQ